MTFKRLLVATAAAAACLALPAASFADPPADQGQGDNAQHHGRGGGKGEKPASAGQAQAPAATTATSAGPAGHVQQGGGGPGGQNHRRTTSQTHTQTQTGPTPAPQGGGQVRGGTNVFTGTPSGPAVHTQQNRNRTVVRQPNQPVFRGPAPAPLTGWNRGARGPDRDQAGQQWRQGHQGWDRSTPWRSGNANWWRGDSAFRLFLGPRIGFFFIPGRGYISVPQQYQVHYWRPGEYLPNFFWSYRVADYDRYGLPQPPDGCEWVWVDNDIALIDMDDGYILDIIHNAW